MKRRLIALLAAVMCCVFVFAACSDSSSGSSESASTEASASEEASESASEEASEAPSESASEEASESASTEASEEASSGSSEDNSDLNVQVIAKGFQHQFWQVVKNGAEAAAKDLGVGTMDFNGPAGESDINEQVDMLNSALAKNPSAVCLAALDTESVTSQLEEAASKDIPVIGFDSGVPDAPEGTIKATAATDNEAAAALAADKMMEDSGFAAKVQAATEDAPVVIGVLSQDATSASVVGRTNGFINGMKAYLEDLFPGKVAVDGHDLYKSEASDGKPVATLLVQVPPSPDAENMRSGAQALLQTQNLVGVFCSNEGAVTGLLNATNDGADLDKENGTYKDVTVAGFDAGSTQKDAVRRGYFIGSVTQDPYQIGYMAVDLAVKAAHGETVEDVDTGAKWYDASNIDDPDIADLVYD